MAHPTADAALHRPIILVGMPGTGKTTVGRGLARQLGRSFVDVDHEIERRCGVRVPVIFELEGEAGFRQRESSVLDECSLRTGVVLATGGGAILLPENRRMLRERGLVVYLRTSPADLYRRTRHDTNRPLLRTADPEATLRQLLAVREPFYLEVADLVCDTGHEPAGRVVQRLTPLVRTYSSESELSCLKSSSLSLAGSTPSV